MKGRIWVGILGAIGAFFISVVVGFTLSPYCGCVSLAVTLIGAAVVGFMVNYVDEDVKADPAQSTNAGGVAGLVTGLGAAAGQIVAAVGLSSILAANPDLFAESQEMLRTYGFEMEQAMALDMAGFASTTFLFAGLCYGVLGIALTAGVSALVANVTKPPPPRGPEPETVPDWGLTAEEAAPMERRDNDETY